VLHCSEATVTITQSRVVVHRAPEPEVQEFAADGFGTELREFAAAVRTGGPSPLEGGEGRQALALSLACYESERFGTPVRLDVPPWRHGAGE
jgi:predicted dehydrogenase